MVNVMGSDFVAAVTHNQPNKNNEYNKFPAEEMTFYRDASTSFVVVVVLIVFSTVWLDNDRLFWLDCMTATASLDRVT